jgi:hypothetical protein
VISAALLAGASFAASAQPVYPLYAYGPPQATAPQSWYYNPYTSGLGPCPQRRGGSDPPCRETMPPSYGQPSFWPRF